MPTEVTIGPNDSIYRIKDGMVIPRKSTRFAESFPVEEFGVRVGLVRVERDVARPFSWDALFRSVLMALSPGLLRRVLWTIFARK